MTDVLYNIKKIENDNQLQPLPGFIYFENKPSSTYAIYYRRTFGRDNKVFSDSDYLGKVIDKDRGLYRNRKRNFFTFNLNDGYGEPELQDLPTNNLAQNVELHFGDV